MPILEYLGTVVKIRKEKENGEQQVYGFINNKHNLQKVIYILLESQNTIVKFVILEYLIKIISGHEQSVFQFLSHDQKKVDAKLTVKTTMTRKSSSNNEMDTANNNCKKNCLLDMPLFNQINDFLLNQFNQLDKIVINSACNFQSQLIRIMWLEIEDHELIIQKIQALYFGNVVRLETIGLILMNFLIQNITSSSYNLGYLQFRKLMNTFQNNGLNNIMIHSVESLKKLFVMLHDQNSQFNMNEKHNKEYLNHSIALFLSCMSFNFNINYFEYDHEADTSDLTSICFPLEWKFFFCDIQFYQNICMTFIKLYRLEQHENVMKIIYILTKMVGVRQMIFQDKMNKKQFILTTLQAITMLINSFTRIDHEMFYEIIEINIKFVQNFHIRKIIKNEQNYTDWLNMLKDFSIYLIHNSEAKIINKLLNKNFELWSVISFQSQNNKVNQMVQQQIKNYAIQIAQNAISRFFTAQESFFEDFSYKSYKKFKNTMRKFFTNLAELFQLNYSENIKVIDELMTQIMQNQNVYVLSEHQKMQQKQIQLSYQRMMICFNLIVQTLFVKIKQKKYHYYVELTGFGEEQNDQLDNISANILNSCFRFIQMDCQTNKEVNNIQRYYIDQQLTILCFLDNYLTITLEGLDRMNSSEQDNKLKVSQKYLPSQMDYQTVIEITTQKLLQNLKINDLFIISYTLSTLKTSLFKLKRELNRNVFSSLPLIQHISNNLMELNNTALNQPKFYKLRIQVYELIAILWLDDYHDNYLQSMNKVIQAIKEQSFGNGNVVNRSQIIKFVRDSTGLCRNIDVAKIFKLYIKVAFPFYSQIFNQEIIKLTGDLEVMNASLKFLLALFSNKGQRYNYDNQSCMGYQVFLNMSGFLITFATQVKADIEKQKWECNQQDTDLKIKMCNKLWCILNVILKGNYINFGVFQLFKDQCCLNYIKAMLDLKFLLFDLIFVYPKCIEQFIDNVVYLSDVVHEMIFEQLEPTYISNLFLLGSTIMRRLIDSELQQSQLSNTPGQQSQIIKDSEVNFRKISNMIYNICQFCYEESNVEYSPSLKHNIALFLQSNQKVIREFMYYLFDLSFNVYKTAKIMSKVSKTLFGLVVVQNQSFEFVKQDMIVKISQNYKERDYLVTQFQSLLQGMLHCLLVDISMKFESQNEDKFSKNLKKVIDNIYQNYAIKENTVQIIQY